jgi:hypothetical protein
LMNPEAGKTELETIKKKNRPPKKAEKETAPGGARENQENEGAGFRSEDQHEFAYQKEIQLPYIYHRRRSAVMEKLSVSKELKEKEAGVNAEIEKMNVQKERRMPNMKRADALKEDRVGTVARIALISTTYMTLLRDSGDGVAVTTAGTNSVRDANAYSSAVVCRDQKE